MERILVQAIGLAFLVKSIKFLSSPDFDCDKATREDIIGVLRKANFAVLEDLEDKLKETPRPKRI